jgi:hypothetical protein
MVDTATPTKRRRDGDWGSMSSDPDGSEASNRISRFFRLQNQRAATSAVQHDQFPEDDMSKDPLRQWDSSTLHNDSRAWFVTKWPRRARRRKAVRARDSPIAMPVHPVGPRLHSRMGAPGVMQSCISELVARCADHRRLAVAARTGECGCQFSEAGHSVSGQTDHPYACNPSMPPLADGSPQPADVPGTISYQQTQRGARIVACQV